MSKGDEEQMTQQQDRRKSVRARAWVALISVVGVALLLFVATSLSHLRSDWTEGQIYTLSDSTRAVVEQLDEPILIRAYITSGLPQPYGRLKIFIEDMLRAYHEAGGGNIGFEVVDPSGDANLSMALNAMKIPKVQVQVVEDDQAQVKQGYLAVVVEYLDSKEVIPVVQSEDGFEYLLTRKIKKLTGKGRARIGVLSAFGAAGPYQWRRLQELVRDDYELVEVDGAGEFPADLSSMIVAGLEEEPSEAFRYRLDQFRMQGHGLLLLAGSAKPMLSKGFEVEPIDTAANQWMKEDLDVVIDSGLVMDKQATRVTVNQQQGGFMFRSLVEYPFLPNVTKINLEHPVTKGLESISIPFAAPLIWRGDEQKVMPLMRSSERASVQSGPPFDVNPLMSQEERFSGMTLRSSLLGLAVEGGARSAFTQQPDSVKGEDPSTGHIRESDATRMIVIGSPALLDDEFMDGENLVAVLNMFDWLSGDEALIELRSRGVTQRPLEPLSSAGRSFFKAVWMFSLPLLVGLLGLIRWWRLKKQRAITPA